MGKIHEDKEQKIVQKVAIIACVILVLGFVAMAFAGVLY